VLTNERSPKMRELVSERFNMIGVPVSPRSDKVYDQSINRMARYILFLYDEWYMFRGALKAMRQTSGKMVAWGEGSYCTLAGAMAAKLRSVPAVWDNHGNIMRFATMQGKSRLFKGASLMFEKSLQRLCDRVVVVSSQDKEDYLAMGFPEAKLSVIPTCSDLRQIESRTRDRPQARRSLGIKDEEMVVLFVGRLNYEPNVQAARYIAEELCPRLRAEFPLLRFVVVGSGQQPIPPPEGMIYTGFVEDVFVWLAAADISVAPLWKGLGIFTKVVESLSAGLPTVVTDLALPGIPELRDGMNCLVASDKGEFLEQVRMLVEDRELRARLSVNGQDMIKTKYSCEVVGAQVEELLLTVGGQAH
jgi:glycosyltransferase involved in cell wall biosynthesis